MSIKPLRLVLVADEFDIIEPAAPDEPMDDEQSTPEVVMPKKNPPKLTAHHVAAFKEMIDRSLPLLVAHNLANVPERCWRISARHDRDRPKSNPSNGR